MWPGQDDTVPMMVVFTNRVDAGRRLAERVLDHEPALVSPVVLGLPRGGVVVAFEVARALEAPLDVIVVRKLGVPVQPELAMGAIGEGGFRVLDPRVLEWTGASVDEILRAERRERPLLDARVARFRGGRAPRDLHGHTAVIVDDGIATGSTARVACAVAHGRGAERVVLAVPVAPTASIAELTHEDLGYAPAAEVVCVSAPQRFDAVGAHYRDFAETSDAEVVRLLNEAARCIRRQRSSGSEE